MTGRDLHDIVLITIDCGRQDYLYTDKAATPNLDQLGEESAVFTNAFSQTNTTVSSHVSIFTSLYPCDHGIYSNFSKPRAGAMNLPAILQRHGWETRAFTGVGFLSWLMGDWCRHNDPLSWLPALEDPRKRGYGLRKLGIIKNRRAAGKTIDHVIRRLASDPSRQFLWIHFFDAHMPYRAPRRLLNKYLPPISTRSGTLLDEIEQRGLFVNSSVRSLLNPSRSLFYYPGTYAAAIEYIDSQIGRLIGFLKGSKRWHRTLMIVTSDHGENLLENGIYCDHTKLFDETTKVPLYWHDPALEGGRLVEHLSQHVDLMPTILDRLQLECGTNVRGRSLLSLLSHGEPPASQPALAEHARAYQFTIRNEQWQFIWKNPEKEHAGGLQLENHFLISRQNHPGDTGYRDVSHRHPGVCNELKRAGQAIITAPLVDNLRREPVCQALTENLKALGYL